MKSTRSKLSILVLGFALLPSCTAKYQQLLRERDMKIKELYAQNAELTATNQDLEGRAAGARQRIASLEQRLAQPQTAGDKTGLQKLKDELAGVDVRVKDNRLTLGINNRVTFGSGSTKLKESAGSVLSKVARVLKRDFPGQRIIVEGHTDDDPLRRTKKLYRHNRHLSLERADAVAEFLIGKCGIAEASVVVSGYGPHQPIRPGGGATNKAANRRVEIVVANAN
jgi:chemotaxis protein MotB